MFQTNLQLVQQTFGQADRKIRAAQAAAQLYHRARFQGRLGEMWSMLIGRSRRVLDLSAVEAAHTVRGRHYVGAQTVPLSQIRGIADLSLTATSFRNLKSTFRGVLQLR